MTSRLVIEYDGTRFGGWAVQPGERTVQGELERALSVVLRRGPSDPVRLTVAGRTDRGVHALAQVASLPGDEVGRIASVNALLPDDIAVLAWDPAAPGFDARADATSRAYVYRVLPRRQRSVFWAGRALWWPSPVDVEALQACAAALVGTHDFTAFTPAETYHVRFSRDVFSAGWAVDPATGLLEFRIEADTFMRHMNRILVGTMLEVASRGGPARTVAEFTALLRGAPRSAAGRTAPPHGLYFLGAGYDGRRVLGPVS